MRRAKRVVWLCVVVLVGAGCAAMRSKPVEPSKEPPAESRITPVPTVPPTTPGAPQAVPLPTRPIKDPGTDKAKAAGKLVGPVITHLGIARADGHAIEPASTSADGTPIYNNFVGSGFMMLIEAKPGLSNLEVGRRVIARDASDPAARPDLEVQVSRDLGDGSSAVCDRRKPNIGGVPGINPPSFAEKDKKIADAINDLSCRFETFIESSSACTMNKQGDFSFHNPETKTQFCMIVAKAWAFPKGDTIISARLRDKEGNPGPVKKIILRHTEYVPPKRVQPTKTPTPSRRRP